MDIDFTNEDLNSALKRAFIFYLDFLQHTQRSRELSLPRHGKGVETTVDAFTEQGLQSQEAATRVCIQYSDRIANSIREWMVSNIGGEGDTTEDEGRESTTLNVGVGDVLDGFSEYIKMERDFINPFSGKLIQPTTPFSAGPSRDYESGIATSQTSLTHRESGENNNLSFHNDSQAQAKIPVQNVKASPLTITVPSDEDVFSESSTQFYSAVATPQLATPLHHSEISSDFTPTYITAIDEDAIMTKRHCSRSRRATSSATNHETVPDMFSDDMIAALELQVALDAEDEELRHQFQFALTLQDESGSSTYSTISRFEMHRLESQAFPGDEADDSSQRQQNDIDLQIVQHLQEDEERRAHEIEREVAEVKWLQELWENDDVEFIQQEELTKETLRLEEERAMRIRADILLAREAERIWEEEEKADFEQQEEFAREMIRAEEDRAKGIQDDIQAAQRAQSQWEGEMRKQEEEQARLDAEEAKRVAARIADEEKRARIEKEDKRREQENTANELRRKKEREESERRARQADCASCMEAGERSEMAMLSCKHAYCGECIAGAFKTASGSKKEFKCCGTTVPVQLASRWLDSAFIASYETLLLERSTPTPCYCSNKSCGKFVPPQHIHGSVCICQACSTRTCKICGHGEHAGVCAEDKDGKKVQDLAQQNGWKTCGTCGQILERTEGCLHMTCRCGAHWCYNCLREWSSCNSTCQR